MCLYGISDMATQNFSHYTIFTVLLDYVYGWVQNGEQDLLISKSYRCGFKILVFVKIMS